MPLPTTRVINSALTGPDGQEVVLIDVVAIHVGDRLALTFEESRSPWRQGVWLATEGMLEVNAVRSPQLTIWQNTAPRTITIRVGATDGTLRLYNIWDSGRGLGGHESQRATSGMVVEELAIGARRYRCNDIGLDPKFEKLVFTLETRDKLIRTGLVQQRGDLLACPDTNR